MEQQQEQTEWDSVNRRLQHHGFKPVRFTDPVENKNLADLVLLDKDTAGEIRATLRTMLADSERRQDLIQELIQSNNQLKLEAQEHMGRAAQHSQRVTELEGMLDGVKGQVQDLEDRYLGGAVQQHGHVQEKRDAQKRCQVLEQKLAEETEAAAQLQRKLYFTVKEEESRLARQTQAFQQIYKRSARQHSPADQQVLDVVDFYETQMIQLRHELKSLKGDSEASEASDQTSCQDVTLSFKTIVKSYQEQLKESLAQKEELRAEVQHLKQELESRPTVKEVNSYKQHLRRVDRLIKRNSIGLRSDAGVGPLGAGSSEQVKESSSCAPYRHLLKELAAVLSGPRAPLAPRRLQIPTNEGSELVEFQGLLPALEAWSRQLHSLQELRGSLNELTLRLMPWQPSDDNDNSNAHTGSEPVRVEDLMLLVDTMLENVSTDHDTVLRSPTRHTLQTMVSHFQKLFDVPSLSGVYPRMNELHRRLGETANAMRNLRDVLDLDDRVPPSEIVNQVSRVVSSTEHSVGLQISSLLGDGDIDSIILKVKENEEFFAAFHSLAVEVLHTLGVSRLDDIMPALRSLKLNVQQH